jgi:hypothetical protein
MLAPFGLGLTDLLRARARAQDVKGYGPGRAIEARATSCVLVWLAGGPSHIDTLDPKPDAPADVRGEFQPIATAVPGVTISEVYPTIAKMLDRVTVVRSMTSPEAEHDRAAHHMLTGYRPSPALVYPGMGSVVSRVRGFDTSALPPYVAVPDAPLFASSGYLTPAYDPFVVGGDPNQDGFRVRDLTPPDRVTLERLRRRREMVHRLDGFASDVSETPLTSSRDKFADQAYDLLTSTAAQSAFQMTAERAHTRERYGRNPFGQSCLLARRLVEAGVGFVTLNDRGMGPLGWDTHAQNFPTIKNTMAPPLDQGVSALIQDLEERGLLDTTLVVVMGEFGRTPKINNMAGRDHHGRANSLIIAGGGMPRGLVLGKTDAKADSPAERPITPADLAATVYSTLGIDPERRFETPDGQPIRLVDKGEFIHELA